MTTRSPELSPYVFRTQSAGRAVLYNSVTRRVLDASVDAAALAAAGFLQGSEEAALHERLFRPRTQLTLTLIATWECNLRCNHCTVLGKLVSEQERFVDVDRLVSFVERYRDAQPQIDTLKISFLGGEPLLRASLCSEVIERTRDLLPNARYDATTNLAMPLGPDQLDLLAQLDDIVVSLDGLEELHNAQRRAFKDAFNPFERTRDNLRQLVAEGLAARLFVQGAIRDDFATLENFQDFQRALMALGVHWNRIAFETIHPAEHKKSPQESFLASLRAPSLRHEACCKYRGGSKLIVDSDDRLYSDYYTWEALGTLEIAIDELLAKHREMVLRAMPALRDPVCASCPVIGYCWGGCTNALSVTGERPSEYCDQLGLIETVRRRAADGSLLEDAQRNDDSCANEP